VATPKTALGPEAQSFLVDMILCLVAGVKYDCLLRLH
jgi:hypothetical protein